MSDILNDGQLAELERLHAAATPPPWEYDGMHNEICTPKDKDEYWLIISECRSAPDQELKDDLGHGIDANFASIAALHNHFPALLRRMREAERERDEAEQEVEELKTNADEYEKDCTKALFAIANESGYEWDEDGATADELLEYVTETLRDLREQVQALRQRCEVMKSLEGLSLDEIAARQIVRDARQRKLGAAEELEQLRAYIQDHIAPDDARDDIRRACLNRIKNLRKEISDEC